MITTNDLPPRDAEPSRGAEPRYDDYQATWRAAQTVYHLGQVESEAERLIQQAELYRPEARELLEAIRLREGERALDLGCGPLGILDELAERVGKSGQVVGLEREDRFRHHAAARLREQGFSNVKLVGGHARRSGLPAEHFHLSHARLLLVNLRMPRKVIEEMVRVTKAGGVVALQEVDWVSWICEPMVDSWIRLKRAARTVWQQDGLDVHIGRRLPAMLRQAGLSDVETRTRIYAWGPDNPKHLFLLGIARRIGKDIVERGLLSLAELERLTEELEMHLHTPGTMVLSPTYFQVWGRKPIASLRPASSDDSP